MWINHSSTTLLAQHENFEQLNDLVWKALHVLLQHLHSLRGIRTKLSPSLPSSFCRLHHQVQRIVLLLRLYVAFGRNAQRLEFDLVQNEVLHRMILLPRYQFMYQRFQWFSCDLLNVLVELLSAQKPQPRVLVLLELPFRLGLSVNHKITDIWITLDRNRSICTK